MKRISIRHLLLWLIPLLLGSLIAALFVNVSRSSRPKSAENRDGNKARFCEFVEDIDREAGKVVGKPTEGLELLRSFEPRFPQFLEDAPSSIKADAETMISRSRAAINANDIYAPSKEVVDSSVGARLDFFCGLTSPSK